jgi:hypothetical protein
MNGSLPRNYGWFSQAARFGHFASRMRSILERFEPFAANRVFEIYTWVRQIRDKSNLTFNGLITAGICDQPLYPSRSPPSVIAH